MRDLRPMLFVVVIILITSASPAATPWFSRVLVTNDDGIDDPRLHALARAFADVAEVVVVAPSENCSGSSNYVSVFSERELTAAPYDMGEGITAWVVEGFPGDCVLLALETIMKDAPPDLLVSGVNAGPNLADAWIASGTIGVARLAAHAGLPAVAFSNLTPDAPSMMAAVPQWCVALAATDAVRDLPAGGYLNVNFPRCAADEVAGVVWAGIGDPIFHDTFETGVLGEDGRTTWKLKWWMDREGPQPDEGDVARHRANYVTVTPMQIGDFKGVLPLEKAAGLPSWTR